MLRSTSAKSVTFLLPSSSLRSCHSFTHSELRRCSCLRTLPPALSLLITDRLTLRSDDDNYLNCRVSLSALSVRRICDNCRCSRSTERRMRLRRPSSPRAVVSAGADRRKTVGWGRASLPTADAQSPSTKYTERSARRPRSKFRLQPSNYIH